MQTRNLDAYRSHAEATSALTLSLPPALSSAPREETIKAMNRLRLTMYINHLDSSTFDIVDDANQIKAWIESHTIETQIFLNALGAGIAEDGVRGGQTVRCIQTLLGIHTVSVIAGAAAIPTVTPAAWAVVATPEGEEVRIPLPDFLENEREARAIIEALGIEWLRIEDGHLIGVNELNTQRKIEQLRRYLEIANYIESGGATPAGKVERYEILIDDELRITDKKYLIFKYMSSMYNDIIESNQIVRPVLGQPVWVYAIYDIESGEVVVDSPYQSVFVESPRTEYVEFARLNAIVGGANSYWNERIVTREWLVEYILESNIINAPGGERIQSVEALLLNKEHVITELQTNIAALGTRNPDQYQQMIWLIDFLEQEQYRQDNIQRNLFNNINHYNRVFEQEHSFIDALTAEWIDPNDANPENEDVIDAMQRVLGDNTIGIALLGIFTMLFGGTHKGKGFWLLIGLFWARIGLNVAESISEEVGTSSRDDGSTQWDTFDIFDPLNLRHRINYEAGFDRENYDPTLASLYEANKTRRAGGEIVDGAAVGHTTNARIAMIFQEVMKHDTLLQHDFRNGDAGTTTELIHTTIDTTIATDSFESPLPTAQTGEVTEADVQIFLVLLRAQGEDGDIRLWEFLYNEGESLASTDFENQDFTIDDNFDTALNTTLRNAWTAALPSATITMPESLQTRRAISEASSTIDTALRASRFEWLLDDIANRDAENTWGTLADKVAGVEDLKINIREISNLPTTVQDSLIEDFDKYIIYLRADAEITRIDGQNGWWVRRQAEIAWIVAGSSEEEQLLENSTRLQEMIDQLNVWAFSINGVNKNLEDDDLYNALEERINTLRESLETEKTTLDDRVRVLSWARGNALRSWVDPHPTNTIGSYTAPDVSEALAEDELSNEFIDTSLDIISATYRVNAAYRSFESGGFTNPSLIVPELRNEIYLLQTAHGVLEGETYTSGSDAEYIQEQVWDLFEAAGAMTLLPTKLSESFNAYFANNLTNITTITNTDTDFTTTAELIRIRGVLTTIETSYNSEFESGVSNFIAWVGWAAQTTRTETALTEASSIFSSMSVTGTENTAFSVAETAIEKQRELAQKAFDYVSSFTLTTPTDFENLVDMHEHWVIDMIANTGFWDVRRIFASKFTQGALDIIDSIPTDVDGIQSLAAFHGRYIEWTGSSYIGRLIIWEYDNGTSDSIEDRITPAFEGKLNLIWSTILNSFGESFDGLREIVAFKATDGFRLLDEHIEDFETQTDQRTQALRVVVRANTLSAYSLDETWLSNIITFMTGSDYSLLGTGDGSLDTDFKRRWVEIITAVMRSFDDTVVGIRTLRAFQTDARYLRFAGTDLDSAFSLVLQETQANARSTYGLNHADISSLKTLIEWIAGIPRLDTRDQSTINAFLPNSLLSDIVSDLWLSSGNEPSSDLRTIPEAALDNIYNELTTLGLL